MNKLGPEFAGYREQVLIQLGDDPKPDEDTEMEIRVCFRQNQSAEECVETIRDGRDLREWYFDKRCGTPSLEKLLSLFAEAKKDSRE